MQHTRFGAGAIAALGIFLSAIPPAEAQSTAPRSAGIHQERVVTTVARGTFDVTMKPLPSDEIAEAAALGRMSIQKQLHGDITGSSKGQMLMTSSAVAGSASYVALERVTGTVHGKRGSFSLQHSAWMAGGQQGMTITVVPDSGTEELVGLKGTFLIIVADGKHSYEFEYSLPDSR